MIKIIRYIFLIPVLYISCAETPCTSVFSNEFDLEYFKIVFDNTDSISVEQPDLNFTRVFALGNEDSLLVEQETNTRITLQVDPNENFTTYIIETLDSITIEDSVLLLQDTLTVGYIRRQRLISEDCGAEQFYIEFEIIESSYDSINLFQDQLKTTNDRFIEIFY